MRTWTFGITLTFVSSLASCKGKSTSPAGVTPMGRSCSSKIIDQGQKGSAATVARGTHSDSRTMPGTGWPALAFTDANALSIKLSYWNGANFTTEAIAGDGAGAFIRLGFLSSGIPVVIWALGTNVKAALRSSPLGQSGTWLAGVIDVATAPRALEMAVNPMDQITITFLTDTAASGRSRFIYCDAPCSTPAEFQTMGTNPWIENGGLVAAQTATGAGWCKVSDQEYYPAATYATAAGVKFALCPAGLSRCLNGANWISTVVTASRSTATKLVLDAKSAGDVPKVLANGTSGIVPYQMGSTSCAQTPGAFTPGPTIGSANSASLWLTGAADPTGRFHLVANEGTTAVRYYNTDGPNFIGAWNPAGTIETTALPALSTGGAALNASMGGIFVSYGVNSLPYDIKLAFVNDSTQASNAATFTRSIADLTGNLQLGNPNAQVRQIAVGSTANLRPGVAYVDFSAGGTGGARLKFAMRSGDAASSPWNVTLVPNTMSPQSPSLRFDAAGAPWISYFEAASNRFYVATNSRGDGTGSWYTYEFPATPSGAPVGLPAANNTALASWEHEGRSDMIMGTIDNNPGSKGVRVSIFNTATRGFSTPALVDSLSAGAAGAANISLEYDSAGTLAVAFQDFNVGRVRFSSSTDGGTTWSSPINVSGVAQGAGARLKVNRRDGTPGMSYFDQANNAVYFAHCAGTLATCATDGWSSTLIEAAAGVSGLATASSQLLTTNLNYLEGLPYVTYPRGQGNDGSTVIANVTSAGTGEVIAARGTNGALPGSPALNFGIAGWGVATSRNASGGLSGAFLGPGNWLYAFSCQD